MHKSLSARNITVVVNAATKLPFWVKKPLEVQRKPIDRYNMQEHVFVKAFLT